MEKFEFYASSVRHSVSEAFETYILPALLSKRQNLNNREKISISAAVALCTMYLVYHRITNPPRHLRHLPRVRSLQLFKALVQNKSLDKYAQEVTLPLALETPSGLYAVRGTMDDKTLIFSFYLYFSDWMVVGGRSILQGRKQLSNFYKPLVSLLLSQD